MSARSPSAYQIALRLLGQRDYSTARLRLRLARRQLPAPEIDAALARLSQAGLVDDARFAEAVARRAAEIKLRGRSRTRRDIEALGVAPDIARRAVAAVFDELDEEAVLARAIAKRVPGRVRDRAQFRRLYQALLRQGFPPDRVAAQLLSRTDDAAAFVEE